VAAVIHWSPSAPSFWLFIIIIGGMIERWPTSSSRDCLIFPYSKKPCAAPGRRKRINVLRALVMQNPSAGNYEELGELLLEEKRYREARDAFDRALSVRTDSIDPFYRRGIAEFELREDEAAVAISAE